MIVVVAKPDRLREALCALLKATFWPQLISQVDDSPMALKLALEHKPALVLLDAYWSDDEVSFMVEQIKTKRPQTRCLVLVNTVEQIQVAKSAGADEALPRGFPITSLLGVINKLMALQDI